MGGSEDDAHHGGGRTRAQEQGLVGVGDATVALVELRLELDELLEVIDASSVTTMFGVAAFSKNFCLCLFIWSSVCVARITGVSHDMPR